MPAKRFFCVFLFFFIITLGFCAMLDTIEKNEMLDHYISEQNYPYENHTILTEDGYYLTTGRIPIRSNKTCDKKRETVLLHHGLLNNGVEYVDNGKNSLGFLLSDRCYDIWLLNTRGTKYSSRHINLTSQDRSFWNFSFDELAKYDMKANIDYVLNSTGGSKIHYIGISKATTEILMFLSHYPEYEKHMIALQLIAPIVYLNDSSIIPIDRLPKQLLYTLSKVTPFLLSRPIPDYDYLFHDILYSACESKVNSALCLFLRKPLQDKAEPTSSNPSWGKDFPDRASLKMIGHYAQIYISQELQTYDYGPEQNRIYYGTETPTTYQYENITTPMYLYHSEGDGFSTKVAVDRIAKRILNLRLKHFIADSKWRHGMFSSPPLNSSDIFHNHLFNALNQASTEIGQKKFVSHEENKG